MEPPQENGPRRSGSPLGYAGLGIEIALPVVLFMFGGHKLDGWLGTSGPWFTVVGALAGMAVGFYGLFRRFAPRGKR